MNKNELYQEWQEMAAESKACGYEYPSFNEWVANEQGIDLSKERAMQRAEWRDEQE